MICSLPGQNARIFAKAVNTIAKFGDLYFEPQSDGLYLKSINASKSAYITFKFLDSFFSSYEYENLSQNSFDGKCKVSIKTFVSVFKNMKQVDECKITIDSQFEKLVIELFCKLDTKKKFGVSILDVEVLQPGNITDVDNRNKICGSTKIFSDISNNFQMAEEEITIVAETNRLIAQNYIDGQSVDQKFMRSQLKLKGEEFDVYSIKNDASVTYCLREFRALLHFAESLNIDFSMFFEDAGMPVIFKIVNLSVFEATLIMSTLSPDDITQIDYNANNSKRQNISENRSKNNSTNKRNHEKEMENRTDTICLDDDNINNDITNAALMQLDVEDEINKSNLSKGITKNKSENDIVRNKDSNISGSFPMPVTLNMNDDDSVTLLDSESDTNEDCIPLSPQPPPSKKLRTLFRRCFEPTFLPSDTDTVLAVDSDNETYS